MQNIKEIKPLGDRVVLKIIMPEEKSPGGVIMVNPEAQKEVEEGIVVEIGPGRQLDNGEHNIIDMKVDDKVIYAKSVGTKIMLNDIPHKILVEGDVIAIYN